MPNREEILELLRQTGAWRQGHFILPSGLHTDHFFQLPRAMRYYDNVRRLGVALSRLLRDVPRVTQSLPHCTVVAPASGGIPVAFAVRDALNAEQVVWAERQAGRLYFRPFTAVQKGDQCILVDDLILTGTTLERLIRLVWDHGGEILVVAVLVDSGIRVFRPGPIPVVRLVEFQTRAYPDAARCDLCRAGVPAVAVEF
ncbi:MAG: phosphoribosyltransferase family protein [Acidobacteria bacterium]|nr:phosphoribosyltransferase family protein [Acidobacteriota bacterium]MDW7984684.1 phosphoribosyltransferase family protein [Acidobacteriota bacterium]